MTTYETVATRHHAGQSVELRSTYPGVVAVVAQMHGAVEEQRTKRGKLTQAARPGFVRCIMSLPLPLDTTEPECLRANARTLLDAADVLERAFCDPAKASS